MLNIAMLSAIAIGASVMTISGATTMVAPPGYSESGSLIVFGLGLLAVSLVVKKTSSKSQVR